MMNLILKYSKFSLKLCYLTIILLLTINDLQKHFCFIYCLEYYSFLLSNSFFNIFKSYFRVILVNDLSNTYFMMNIKFF